MCSIWKRQQIRLVKALKRQKRTHERRLSQLRQRHYGLFDIKLISKIELIPLLDGKEEKRNNEAS